MHSRHSTVKQNLSTIVQFPAGGFVETHALRTRQGPFIGYALPVSRIAQRRTLSEADVTRLTFLARAAVQTLRAYIRALPVQTVRGLAGTLNVDQSLVQRTLAGIDETGNQQALNALLKLPPAASLRKLLTIARNASPSVRQARDDAAAALTALDAAATELGGPRRFKLRVRQAIEHEDRPSHAAHALPLLDAVAAGDPSHVMHFSSAAIAGSDSRAKVRVNIIWPDATDSQRFNNALAGGAIGTRHRPGGMPMYAYTDLGETRDAAKPGRLTSTLEPFSPWCTQELSTSTRRLPQGGSVVVVDDHRASGPEGINLMLANLTQFEPHSPTLFLTLLTPMLTPARRLIADVYLERTLAARLVPKAGVFIHMPAILVDPSDAWRTQIPQRIAVEALGPGFARAETHAWDGHDQLTKDLARRASVDPATLVGYRIDVINPLWGMAYCMWFDLVTH